MLIIGSSESGKTNALQNLVNHKLNTDKSYLYTKSSYKSRYQFLIKKHECAGLKHCDNYKSVTECSNDMDNF